MEIDRIIGSAFVTLMVAGMGWLIASMRGMDTRLREVEKSIAVLLERTASLAPVRPAGD